MGLLEDMAPYTTGDILQRLPTAKPLSEKERRKLVKKEMAGQDLTPEEARKVENDAARAEGWSDKAASTGLGLMAEATGVPSIMRGADNIGRAYTEGDMARGLGGAGEVAMGLIPGAMVARGPTRAAIGALYGSAPRAAATTAALGATGLPMHINDAVASGENKVLAKINSDPVVQQLKSEMNAIEAERIKSATKPIKGMSPAGAEKARAQADAAYNERLSKAQTALKEAETRIRDGYMENAPFRERHPQAAESMFTGAAALAGALPFANTLKTNLANRFVLEPAIARQAAKTERALVGGMEEPGFLAGLFGAQSKKVKPSEAAFGLEQDVLKKQLARLEDNQPSYLKNAAIGSSLIAESRMLPEEIDAVSFPHGHPTRDAATEALTSPSYYMSGVVPSLLAGVGASSLGTKAGDILSLKSVSPKMDRAKSLSEMNFPQRGTRQAPSALPPEYQLPSQAGPIPPALQSQPLPIADQSQAYKSYKSIPSEDRAKIRDSYISERGLFGADLPPRQMADAIKAPYEAQGVKMPVTPARVKATNDAYNEFVAVNKRLPTQEEWQQIFGRATLAIPALAVGGASLMDFNSR